MLVNNSFEFIKVNVWIVGVIILLKVSGKTNTKVLVQSGLETINNANELLQSIVNVSSIIDELIDWSRK